MEIPPRVRSTPPPGGGSLNPDQAIPEFEQRIRDYRAGRLPADEFKACRLKFGIYGIRGLTDRQMVRIKVPGGQLTAAQLLRLADVSEGYATGRAHATTRQAIQLYEVPIERVPSLIRELAGAGLTTREACGNSVRNVTVCPFAGLCGDELFDVTPYALAVVRHFLWNPVSQALPRKFKISFSGCRQDHAMGPIHDIGAMAVARTTQGRTEYGFQLLVGGGLGSAPRVADLLEPFTPVEQLVPTCEAIVRVFDAHGDRTNRSRARMKFLIERTGLAEFRRLVEDERGPLLARGGFPSLPTPQPATASPWTPPALPSVDPGLARWVITNARPQRQPGYWIATARLPLGDMTVTQLRGLAALAVRHSRGLAVTTQWQDLAFPWIETADLPLLYSGLVQLGLAQAEGERIQDVTSCPGADTCQIGITSSRGLAQALAKALDHPEFQEEAVSRLRIKTSGCPNSCGQHHIADIGLFGAAKQMNGVLVPHYQVLVGGRIGEGSAQFGRAVIRLPARRIPEAVTQLVRYYQQHRGADEPFSGFVERVGLPAIRQVLEPYTAAPEGDRAGYDWDKQERFSLVGMGPGECAG